MFAKLVSMMVLVPNLAAYGSVVSNNSHAVVLVSSSTISFIL